MTITKADLMALARTLGCKGIPADVTLRQLFRACLSRAEELGGPPEHMGLPHPVVKAWAQQKQLGGFELAEKMGREQNLQPWEQELSRRHFAAMAIDGAAADYCSRCFGALPRADDREVTLQSRKRCECTQAPELAPDAPTVALPTAQPVVINGVAVEPGRLVSITNRGDVPITIEVVSDSLAGAADGLDAASAALRSAEVDTRHRENAEQWATTRGARH